MNKYLERAAAVYPCEPCCMQISGNTHFAVIPIYDENENIFHTLASIKNALQHSPELVKIILVVNEPPTAPEKARLANSQLLESLRKNDGKYDGELSVGGNLFFIDLTNKGLPEKFCNVGNARKTGFDSVIAQSDGKVTEKSTWLFSLDADTSVAPDYFQQALLWAKNHPAAGGAVFHFEHRFESGNEALDLAAMRYEIYLRDYAYKLRSCGSRYGFWTIGSAFMCNMSDYMRCGGMRRCAAGEDFYFLQALNKVAPVGTVPGTTVYPAGRVSDRVPFGTGPAIAAELAGRKQELYNQNCFDLLKEFFSLAEKSQYSQLVQIAEFTAESLVGKYLKILDFAAIWQKIVRNTPKNHPALLNALHTYCDGFFILKFCHWLEENYPEEFSRIPLPDDLPAAEYLEKQRKFARDYFC